MLDDNAYGLSRRRVTLSTSGIVPAIDRLARRCPVALAVSLHAPNDALRDRLVPINRKYPLARAARRLQPLPRTRAARLHHLRVRDARRRQRRATSMRASCSASLRDVPCKFNLIPFNPFPDSGFERSAAERDPALPEDAAATPGSSSTTRKTRGDDIDAACGQLAGEVAGPHARARGPSASRRSPCMKPTCIAPRSPRCVAAARRLRCRTAAARPTPATRCRHRHASAATPTEPAQPRARSIPSSPRLYYERGNMASRWRNCAPRSRPTRTIAPRTTCSAWCTWNCARTRRRRRISSARCASSPNDPDINHNYGWFLCQTGREDESIAYFLQARAQPAVSDAGRSYVNAGRVLAAQGQRRRRPRISSSARCGCEPDNPAPLLQPGADPLPAAASCEDARRLVGRYNRLVEPPPESLWLGAAHRAQAGRPRRGERATRTSCGGASPIRREYQHAAARASMTERTTPAPATGASARAAAARRARALGLSLADVAQQLSSRRARSRRSSRSDYDELPGRHLRARLRAQLRALLKLDAGAAGCAPHRRRASRCPTTPHAVAERRRRPIPITDSAPAQSNRDLCRAVARDPRASIAGGRASEWQRERAGAGAAATFVARGDAPLAAPRRRRQPPAPRGAPRRRQRAAPARRAPRRPRPPPAGAAAPASAAAPSAAARPHGERSASSSTFDERVLGRDPRRATARSLLSQLNPARQRAQVVEGRPPFDVIIGNAHRRAR